MDAPKDVAPFIGFGFLAMRLLDAGFANNSFLKLLKETLLKNSV